MAIPLADAGEHSCEFGTHYFTAAANRIRAELIRSQAIDGNSELFYRLSAFLDDGVSSSAPDHLAINLEPADSNHVVRHLRRRDLGTVESWDQPLAGDLPIMIDHDILEQAVEEARSHPEQEVGGFLLGHLTRDTDTDEVFVAVTGLVSAEDTVEANATSVTFTPASFAHVRRIIQLRGRGESIIGWSHSHPFRFCAECPLPTPPECISKVLFYSDDDLNLMETTFEQPFMVGLLAAVEPKLDEALGHLPVRVFGWREGEIVQRGFQVLRPVHENTGE